MRYTVYSVCRVYRRYTITIMVPGIQWYTGLQPSLWPCCAVLCCAVLCCAVLRA